MKSQLIRLISVAILTFAICSCGQNSGTENTANADPTVRWRLASSFPHSLDTIFGAAETLSQRVESLSGGKFTIRIYPAGELVPGLEVMDAVQQGTVQIGHTASYYYIGKHPALVFDTTVPFGLTAREQTAWMYKGGGREAMAPIFEQFGIISFPGGNTGAQMGGWFRKSIESMDDIVGLKMRIPGVGGKIMNRLGVNVQVLSGGDIYPALDRGAIDATEWVGPYDDAKLGFNKVASNYYYPGWWEPGPQLSFMINKKAWDGLPEKYRFILESATKEAHLQMLVDYDTQNPIALQQLKDAGNIQLKAFPADFMAKAEEETQKFLEEQAQENEDFKKVYEEWSRFKKSSNNWQSLSEYHFRKHLYDK